MHKRAVYITRAAAADIDLSPASSPVSGPISWTPKELAERDARFDGMIKEDHTLGRADPRFFKKVVNNQPIPYFSPYVEYGPSRNTLLSSQPKRKALCPPKQAAQSPIVSDGVAAIVVTLFIIFVFGPLGRHGFGHGASWLFR
jgi:hypothetical protein